MNSPQVYRIPGLWFDDGNIVIQAQSSQYRLYRYLLSRKSPVLAEILARTDHAKVDCGNGCNLDFVELDDEEEDLTCFLRALVDSSYFEAPSTVTHLTILSSILRLSIKYRVPYLRARALAHFDSAYPTTFPGWQLRERIRTIPPLQNTPFAILAFSATHVPIPWVLPAIYYCLCTHPLNKTLDGVTWEGRDVQLGWEEIARCASGRAKLLCLQMRNVVRLLVEAEDMTLLERWEEGRKGDVVGAAAANGTPESSGGGTSSNETAAASGPTTDITHVPVHSKRKCTDPKSCRALRQSLVDLVTGWGTIGYFDLEDENADIYKDLCGPCMGHFRSWFRRTAEEMWRDLPALFGLPDWEVLNEWKRQGMDVPDDS